MASHRDEENVAPVQPTHSLPDLPEKDTSNLDESYEIYQRRAGETLDPIEAKRVLRKVDLRILPILVVLYLLQYLDKNGINYASAYGLQEALNLQGQDFSWLSSIFYFGYMFAQYPAGYLMQRFPTAKVLSSTCLGWGIILMTTPACKNFAGIAANRFLLGALEAFVNPVCLPLAPEQQLERMLTLLGVRSDYGTLVSIDRTAAPVGDVLLHEWHRNNVRWTDLVRRRQYHRRTAELDVHLHHLRLRQSRSRHLGLDYASRCAIDLQIPKGVRARDRGRESGREPAGRQE